jgi:CheY-like chemotaxis protein
VSLALQASGSGDRREIVFAVIDSGIGIDQATRERLFQRFAQGDDSRSRRHGGTGLGLEISRNLARLMGGDLSVQSSPGQGSRFELRLPLQAAEPPSALPAPTAAAAAARQLRVLAAEDNAVNREVLAAMIAMGGHQVTFAENGSQAVAAVRAGSARPFDLVLMDLHMPELDGIGAARAIRALEGPAGLVPIVALTADAFSETRARCLDAGMNGFLSKPVGLDELSALLSRHAA